MGRAEIFLQNQAAEGVALLSKGVVFIFQVGCYVPLHPLGGADHKTTSFSNPSR